MQTHVDESENSGIQSLDLTSHAVLAHFAKSSKSAYLLTFLLSLDRIDKWAVDFNEDQSAKSFEIQLFMQDLQKFVESSYPVLHRVPKEFSEILAHLTTSKCMYLIRYVGQRNDGFLDSLSFLLADGSSQSADVAAVKRRLEAFSKAKLLGDIFSGKRLTRIMEIMGSYSDV